MSRLRAEKGLTLERVAHRTVEVDPKGKGLTHGALSHNSTGKHAPRERTLELVAAALDAVPEEFTDYRLAMARRLFNPRDPEYGGVGFDQAAANLAALEAIMGAVTAEAEQLPGAALEGAEEAVRRGADRRRRSGRREPGPPGNGRAAG